MGLGFPPLNCCKSLGTAWDSVVLACPGRDRRALNRVLGVCGQRAGRFWGTWAAGTRVEEYPRPADLGLERGLLSGDR